MKACLCELIKRIASWHYVSADSNYIVTLLVLYSSIIHYWLKVAFVNRDLYLDLTPLVTYRATV